MDESEGSSPPPVAPVRRTRRRLLALGVAAGLALAGIGVAVAQTSTTETPGTSEPKTVPAPGPGFPAREKFGLHGFGHRGHFGKIGKFGGFGGLGIHGEFTVPKPDGGYQTIASQIGEVTSASKSSITAKSEDGFDRTYTVDENTLVNAGRDGIDSVKNGDKVRVSAVVEGGKARAVNIVDTTNVERIWERLRPPRPTK